MSVKYHLGLERKMAQFADSFYQFKPSRSVRKSKSSSYGEAIQHFFQGAYSFMYQHRKLIEYEIDTFKVGLDMWMTSLTRVLFRLYPESVSLSGGILNVGKYASAILGALGNISVKSLNRKIIPPTILLPWKTKPLKRSLPLSLFHWQIFHALIKDDSRRGVFFSEVRDKFYLSRLNYRRGVFYFTDLRQNGGEIVFKTIEDLGVGNHKYAFIMDMIESNALNFDKYIEEEDRVSFESDRDNFHQNAIVQKFRSVFIKNAREGESRFPMLKASMNLSTFSPYLTQFLIYAHGQRHQLVETDALKLDEALHDYLSLSLKKKDISVMLALMDEVHRYPDWVTHLFQSASGVIRKLGESKKSTLIHHLFKSASDWFASERYTHSSESFRDGIDAYLTAMIPLLKWDPMEILQLEHVQFHIKRDPSKHLTRLSGLLESLSVRVRVNAGQIEGEKPALIQDTFIL